MGMGAYFLQAFSGIVSGMVGLVDCAVCVGTSGFSYNSWKGGFYPEKLPQKKFLAHYASKLASVEVNASFYRLPTGSTLAKWAWSVPPSFRFSMKAWKAITHNRKLADVADSVSLMLDRLAALGDRLGAVLFQLPPGLTRDDGLLDDFLALLPSGTDATVEFRHRSWFADPVFEILRRRGAAMCVFHSTDLESPFEVTADFLYLRFHGTAGRFKGSYGPELADWAERIARAGAHKRVIYAYFNNDADGSAPGDALALQEMLAGSKSQEGS